MNPAHRILDPAMPAMIPAGLCALAVMTKVPQAGKVKTRLQPPLTAEEAAALNVCFLRDTFAAIAEAGKKGGAVGVAVYTPVGAEAAYAGILPDQIDLVPQRGEAFGDRLKNALDDLFQLGFSSACLIDSDSPTVPVSAYAEAARVLAATGDRIVLGPSDDGGYYLIGMKKTHRRLFEEIDWSTERVLPRTLERAGELGLAVHQLPTWYDVDDRATLRRLCEELFGVQTGERANGFRAPQTRHHLACLIESEGRERIWPAGE